MLHQIRRFFRTEPALPAQLHYHMGDDGERYVCDDSVCRPTRTPNVVTSLIHPLR